MPPQYTAKSTGEQVAADFSTHIQGRTILVTGVSPGGLGASFAQAIAPHNPGLLILAGRNSSKAAETTKTLSSAHPGLRTRTLTLDLASQKQVREAAAEVNGWADVPRIDVLVNNAGIMAVPYGKTPEGLEMHFGTNHVGPFLFTNLIMGKILAAGKGARIVSVSSDGYRLSAIRFKDYGFQDGKVYNKWRAYGQSKTANNLFAISLAKRLGAKGVSAVSLHPGAIPTNLSAHIKDRDTDFGALFVLAKESGCAWGDSFSYKSLEEGVATHVRAAFDPSLSDFNGAHLQDANVLPAGDMYCWGRDPVDAEKLWALSEELVGEKFQY